MRNCGPFRDKVEILKILQPWVLNGEYSSLLESESTQRAHEGKHSFTPPLGTWSSSEADTGTSLGNLPEIVRSCANKPTYIHVFLLFLPELEPVFV